MTTSEFFENYSSATVAGGANQFFFSAKQEVKTVAYYRPFFRGVANYSLLFTSTIDSTFDDGSKSRAEDKCGDYEISGLALAVISTDEKIGEVPRKVFPITVNGINRKHLYFGESFVTDPVYLDTSKCKYIAVLMTVKGDKIPCHPENQIPTFWEAKEGLVPSKDVYLPAMIGVDAPTDIRIGFVGDSITQGVGCAEDSYLNYVAVCADKLKDKCSYRLSFWNLGIGFARGADFALNGAWAEKAKHCDIVIVCFGVNDLFHVEGGLETHINHFDEIILILKSAGCRVVLQAIPPFDFDEEREKLRLEINNRLRVDFAKSVDLFFDETPFLSSPEDRSKAVYGGHPNEIGCAIWGEKLADSIQRFINKI